MILARLFGPLLAAGVLAVVPDPQAAPVRATPSTRSTPARASRAETPMRVYATAADTEDLPALAARLAASRQRVEAFFDGAFPEPVTVFVHPDRAAFTHSFPREWGMTSTQCWMVAYGVADALSLLSPRAWPAESCEHDPDDSAHVDGILAHELVHVFHGQHNATRDFTGIEEDVGWFAEGLAVYASGQLEDDDHADAAREALRNEAGPTTLASAWSGRYRYGVCGSLAAFLDHRLGREGLTALLAATSLEQLLAPTGMAEPELLEAWEAWVLSSATESSR